MKRLLSFALFAVVLAAAVVSCKEKEPVVLTAPSISGVVPAENSAEVSWNAVDMATTYVLQLKAPSADWADKVSVSATSTTLTGLSASTEYQVRVKAKGGEGTEESPFSAAYRFTTLTPDPGPGPDPGTTGFTYPLTISKVDDFITWINEYAGQCEPADVTTLGADMDLTGKSFSSVGMFNGTFDGAGKTIKGLSTTLFSELGETAVVKNVVVDATSTINWTDTILDMTGIGFIAGKSSGKILNCSVAGSIKVKSDDAGRIYCAGIVGESLLGYVEGCKFTGNIDVELTTNSKSCSSIAGVVARGGHVDKAGQVIIKDCVNEGHIKFLFSGPTKGMLKFGNGGVLGQTPSYEASLEGDISKDCGIVEGCTNKGTIEWSYPAGGNGSYPAMGGVAGIVEGKIIKCNNYGKLIYTGSKTTAATDAAFGGVAGIVTLGASDCHNYGTIEIDAAIAGGTALKQSGGNTEYSCYGGVFASAGPYVTASVKTLTSDLGIVVENCTNEAEIVFTPSMVNSGGPQMCFGGVVGASTAILRNCHNNKPVTIKSNTRTIDAGAITGWSVANIENCTNNAAFVVDGDLENHQSACAYQQCYVGGIVGKCFSIEVKDCKNNSPVTLQNVFKSDDNMSYVGGINANYDGDVTITGCENKGDITSSANTAFRMGGISGAFSGVMSDTKNSGKVSCTAAFEGTVAAKPGEIGGITGYTAAKATTAYKNVEQTGDVSSETVTGAVSGWAGSTGLPSETSTYVWEGCTVKCAVSGATPVKGAVVGWFNNPPTESTTEPGSFTNKVTLQLGTAAAPFKVQGAVASLDLVGNLNGHAVDDTNVQK